MQRREVPFGARFGGKMRRYSKFAIGSDEIVQLEASIKTARIWQDPDRCPAKRYGLPAPAHVSLPEQGDERRFAQECQIARAVAPDLSSQPCRGLKKFMAAKLIGPYRRPIDSGGKAVSMLEDGVIVFGENDVGCESREMKHAPESIAAACEVVAHPG